MAEVSKLWKLQEQICRLRLEQLKFITAKGDEFADFLEEIEKKLRLEGYNEELYLRAKGSEERQEFYIEQAKELKKRVEDDFEDFKTGFSKR